MTIVISSACFGYQFQAISYGLQHRDFAGHAAHESADLAPEVHAPTNDRGSYRPIELLGIRWVIERSLQQLLGVPPPLRSLGSRLYQVARGIDARIRYSATFFYLRRQLFCRLRSRDKQTRRPRVVKVLPRWHIHTGF